LCVCGGGLARTVTRCSFVYKTTNVVTGWDENINRMGLQSNRAVKHSDITSSL